MTHSRSINSNFEADVLETQAKLGKILMIFVISLSKLTKKRPGPMKKCGRHIQNSLLVSLVFSPEKTKRLGLVFSPETRTRDNTDGSLDVLQIPCRSSSPM